MTQRSQSDGFSMIEILVALALMSVIALFVMPKLLIPFEDRQAAGHVRETFTLIGEMYMNRRHDPNPIYGPPDTAAENAKFGQYISDHIDAITNSSGLANYCPDNTYFSLADNVSIRKICDCTDAACDGGTGAEPANLQITIQVPVSNATHSMQYTMVIPKTQDRYTTLYGFKKDYGIAPAASDYTLADTALKIPK